jgi:hypothetical protein
VFFGAKKILQKVQIFFDFFPKNFFKIFFEKKFLKNFGTTIHGMVVPDANFSFCMGRDHHTWYGGPRCKISTLYGTGPPYHVWWSPMQNFDFVWDGTTIHGMVVPKFFEKFFLKKISKKIFGKKLKKIWTFL